MNPIRYLENRIHGWLPKKPNIPKKATLQSFQRTSNHQTPTQYQNGTRVTTYSGTQTLIWALLGSLWLLSINAQFHTLLSSQIMWIFFGLAAGLVLSTLFTQKQLKSLQEKGEIRLTLQTVLYIVGALLVFAGAFTWVVFSDLPVTIRVGLLNSVFASAPGVHAARAILFSNWERKNKKRIFQNRWSSRLYVFPKSDTQYL